MDISALISSTSRLKLEDGVSKSEIDLVSTTTAINVPSVKDIIEAYAYHEILEEILNGEEPSDWSDSDDYASTISGDGSQIELSEVEEEEPKVEVEEPEPEPEPEVQREASSKNKRDKKIYETETEEEEVEEEVEVREESDDHNSKMKQAKRAFSMVKDVSNNAFKTFNKKMEVANDDSKPTKQVKKAFSSMKGAFSKFGKKKKEETESEGEEEEEVEDPESKNNSREVPNFQKKGGKAQEDEDDEVTKHEGDNEAEEADEDEDEGPTEPFYLLNASDELTVPTSGTEKGCPNAKIRPDMWMSEQGLGFPDEMGFLTQVGNVCITSRVRDCGNKSCSAKRAEMEGNAPTCGWVPFRRWAIVAMSCQAAMTKEQKLSVAHTHIARAVEYLAAVLKAALAKHTIPIKSTLDEPESESSDNSASKDKMDVAGVLNLIYWMMNVQTVAGTGAAEFGRWDQRLIPQETAMPPIYKALKKLESLHICKNRLWCLILLSDRKDGDIPDIVATMGNSAASFRHEGHDACTPSKCNYTFLNTTKIEQLHKCVEPGRGRRVCGQEKIFPVEILETALELGRGTAWSTVEMRLCRDNEPYIAISHVWADGTGIGLKNPGTVNRCLFGYFSSIADRLGCKGMWWDSLSIPIEPNARSKALNRMNASYKDAKYTVVHDSYLLNFEWKNDGSPCLAIVLSAWFTRGWTALELAMSERVVVLYKGPDEDTPLIKDLDRDILAHDPSTCSRAHWLASSLIRRLRQRVSNVPDLLTVLRPRFTTKAKDRAEIAGLLAGIRDLNYNRFEGEITKDILRFFGAIPYSCLMHGKPTLRDSGPFSWCATSLEDMPIELGQDMESQIVEAVRPDDDYEFLDVSLSGAVEGWWDWRPLTSRDLSRIKTYGDDLSTDVKVKSALLDLKSCVLLLMEYEEDMEASDKALLVQTVGATGECLECRYVGAVHVRPAANEKEEEDDCSWETWELIRIGNDEGKHPISVQEAQKIMEDTPIEDDDNSTTTSESSCNESDSDENSDAEDENQTTNDNTMNGGQVDLVSDDKKEPPKPWWDSRDDVQPYQRPKNESELVYYGLANVDQDELNLKLSKLSNGDSDTFLYALKARNEDAVRYLVKCGVDLSPQMKKNIRETLGEKKHGELTKMLADVYRDSGKLTDARKMYRYAIYHAGRKPGTRIAEAKQELANICVGLGKADEAMKLYQDVLKFCKEKSNIKKEKADAKEDQKKQKEAKNEAPQQRQRKGSVVSIAPNAKAKGKSEKDKEAEKEKEKEKTPEQRMGRLERLEFNAIASLSLLYADQGDLYHANQTYVRALRGLGRARDMPEFVEAFSIVPKDKLQEDYKHREGDLDRREAVYKLAARRFSNDLGDDHPMTLLTAINMGLNYGAQNKKADCEELVRDALRGFRKIYSADYMKMASRGGTEHVIVICCLSWLAKMLQQDGKTEDATTMFRHVVSGFSTKLSPTHPLSLTNLVELGSCLMVSGFPGQAEGMFIEAISGFEENKERFGRNHKVTANIYRFLGRAYALQSATDQAEESLRQAVGRLELNKAYSPNHLYYCYAVMALAQFQEDQRAVADAERNYRTALAGFEKSAGPKNTDTLECAESLARLCETKGSFDEAVVLYVRVLEGYDDLLGAYNTLTLQASGHLGLLYRKLNMLDLAEQHWRRAYKGYKKSPETDTPRLLKAAYELGKVYKAKWQWPLAEEMLQEAYIGLNSIETPEYREITFAVAMNFGEVLLSEGKLEESKRTYKSAISIGSGVFGEDSPSTLRAMLRLSNVLIEQRRFGEAESMLDELTETCDRVRRSQDSESIRCGIMVNQGRLLHKQGNLDDARSTLVDAVGSGVAAATSTPEGKRNTLDAKASLSHVFIQLRHWEEAVPLVEDAYKGYEQLNDSATLDAMDSLGRLYRQLGRNDEATRLDSKLQKQYEALYGREAAKVIMKMSRKSW